MEPITSPVGKFLDPVAIIAQLGIEKGSIVADFGCGPGYFTFPLSKEVGNDGKIYSFDILPHILEAVSSKAKFSGITNIVTKRANLENPNGTKLEDNSVDLVILKDIVFQNTKKAEIIKEAYRILKPGGRALLIEWDGRDMTIGPSSELRVSEDKLKKMFIEENFSIEKQIVAGDFHYAFIAKK